MHRRAAGWIEALAGARPEDLADLLAHHYGSALRATSGAAGRADPELAVRVPPASARQEAGDRAQRDWPRFATAAGFYESGARVVRRSRTPDRPLRSRCATARRSSTPRAAARTPCAKRPTRSLDAGRARARPRSPWSSSPTSCTSPRAEATEARRDLESGRLAASRKPRRRRPRQAFSRTELRFHVIADETDEARLDLPRRPWRSQRSSGSQELQAAHPQHAAESRGR